MVINSEKIKEGCSIVVGVNEIESKKTGKKYKAIHVITKEFGKNDSFEAGNIMLDEDSPVFKNVFNIGDVGMFMFVGSGNIKKCVSFITDK